MKRITSINNAIKYFSENTSIETRRDSKGDEYKVYIPPVGFHRMNVSQNILDKRGRLVAVVTQHFHAGQWRNYVDFLCRAKDKIDKLVVYYE